MTVVAVVLVLSWSTVGFSALPPVIRIGEFYLDNFKNEKNLLDE